MNKDNFIKELSLLAPSIDELYRFGTPEALFDEIIKGYLCTPKSNPSPRIITSDEILSMLQCYDCFRIIIGNLSFLKDPIEMTDYYQIGVVELDVLVIDKVTLEIEVRDCDALKHTIWSCAANSSRFLDALLVCSKYLRLLLNQSFFDPNGTQLLNAIKQCVDISGGEKYRNFYEMLLGYFG